MKRKDGDFRWDPVTHEQLAKEREYNDLEKELEHRETFRLLRSQKNSGELSVDEYHAMRFIEDFKDMIARWPKSRPIPTSSTEETRSAFLQLRHVHGLNDTDVLFISMKTLLRRAESHLRRAGRGMMHLASEAGNVQATVRIVHQAYLHRLDDPNVLQRSELAPARERLSKMAEMGTPWFSMVLAGQIAYAEGDNKKAIALLTAAMEPAQRYWENSTINKSDSSGTIVNLTTPWLDLVVIQSKLGNFREAQWAADIGCKLDDPTAHYYATTLAKRRRNQHDAGDEGEFIYTSAWLYHMTKAAVSNHVGAMHELGTYYATSQWPYIEDEDDPPDHVKPTPFDRYPPTPGNEAAAITPFWKQAVSVWGTDQRTPDPIHDIFHTAAFPATVKERLEMAIQWLEVAMGYYYAPSYLLAAALYRAKEQWAGMAVPKEALWLSDKRYKYANREDFQTRGDLEEADDHTMVPNPFYNPDKAKQMITEIFYAEQALRLREKCFRRRAQTAQQRQDARADWRNILNGLPYNISKWFSWPDFQETFMDEQNWVLYDKVTGFPDMAAEAKRICEEEKWDIYAEHDGGLLYRHGIN